MASGGAPLSWSPGILPPEVHGPHSPLPTGWAGSSVLLPKNRMWWKWWLSLLWSGHGVMMPPSWMFLSCPLREASSHAGSPRGGPHGEGPRAAASQCPPGNRDPQPTVHGELIPADNQESEGGVDPARLSCQMRRCPSHTLRGPHAKLWPRGSSWAPPDSWPEKLWSWGQVLCSDRCGHNIKALVWSWSSLLWHRLSVSVKAEQTRLHGIKYFCSLLKTTFSHQFPLFVFPVSSEIFIDY